MGKILVIRDSDFSSVSIGNVTLGMIAPVIPTITVDTVENTATLSTRKSGLEIYYTLDGSTPSPETSIRYTDTITNVGGKTIKAISYNGERSSNVPVVTVTYDEESNTLNLESSVSGTIRYTDNGVTPTASSASYASGITVAEGKTYKAVVFNGIAAVSEEVIIQFIA